MLKYVKFKCTSCHQVFTLYAFMFDKWVHHGLPFDEFTLVKQRVGGKYHYFAEISFAPIEECKLSVSVTINNKTLKGYESEQ